MKVTRKNKDPNILSNFEVYKLLNELKSGSGTQGHSSNLATIVYETSHYLQDEPCSKQTASNIDRMLTYLDQFSCPVDKNGKTDDRQQCA
ncbi:DNA-directed RNA polymerase III subunit RPC9 [Nilaparvata lugens]|uniref:DNA-directed RNA polymerase III subunit RPC9 n=1 Tax=Nilaparvata lugens TaxID=108931 RepID=UPI00193E9EEF|nr:DNA-directed RNA polymerase III subunit RPC9 [Nilaparvata lugens]